MKKALKITGIATGAIVIIILLLLLFPFLFREQFGKMVKSTANSMLKTELGFTELDLSFFTHFPHLTITLEDVFLKSSAPFSGDTLLHARQISFGVNVMSLFSDRMIINRVYVDRGRVNVRYNEAGQANFDVYQTSDSLAADSDSDTTSAGVAEIHIREITFSKTDFHYSDPAIPMSLDAYGINYKGKSKITGNILHLTSAAVIDSADVVYDNLSLIESKPVSAQLTTIINTSTLEIGLEKNDLRIVDIPFSFKGKYVFRENGYEMVLSLTSQYEHELFSTSLKLISTEKMWLFIRSTADIGLEKWTKGLGIEGLDLKGRCKLDLVASGEYATGQNPRSNQPDTVILSVPEFSLDASVSDGYFRYGSLPEAIKGINFKLNAQLESNRYQDVRFSLDSLTASLMNNRIGGHLRLNRIGETEVDALLKTGLNLEDLHKAIPLDSLELAGRLDLNLTSAGLFAPTAKKFPETNLSLNLTGGSVKTHYYPNPVKEIGMAAKINNKTGELKDTKVMVEPLTFQFEGNPFTVTARVENPDDPAYDVRAGGIIDLARITKVFGVQGTDITGFIKTNLHLKGRKSDVMQQNISRLHNSGSLELRDIVLTTSTLPLPFTLKSGLFRFDQENVWFDRFNGIYGKSDISMDGSLRNVIRYFFDEKSILKGDFNFSSNRLVADEFIASGESAAPATSSPEAVKTSATEGVVIIPPNLDLALKFSARKISFMGLDISDLLAALKIRDGLLLLKGASADIIGCKVALDASYGSINPRKAHFEMHIRADDFDVKRAYNEVELFRNLSTSAGKCEGIISLDYSLSGVLRDGMEPVYPSLKGGGTITLGKVKVMGLKLFTDMSRNLEREKLKSPDLAKVELKTTIQNNVITLERTKMKISGFRLRIEGETNFDGSLNLKTRLGLPPLGIVGIPMRILGTQDQPKFKYGRGSNDEDVEETEYSDEVPAEFLEKVRKSKDDPDPDQE